MIFHIRQKFFKGILFFYSFEYVDGDLSLIFRIIINRFNHRFTDLSADQMTQ